MVIELNEIMNESVKITKKKVNESSKRSTISSKKSTKRKVKESLTYDNFERANKIASVKAWNEFTDPLGKKCIYYITQGESPSKRLGRAILQDNPGYDRVYMTIRDCSSHDFDIDYKSNWHRSQVPYAELGYYDKDGSYEDDINEVIKELSEADSGVTIEEIVEELKKLGVNFVYTNSGRTDTREELDIYAPEGYEDSAWLMYSPKHNVLVYDFDNIEYDEFDRIDSAVESVASSNNIGVYDAHEPYCPVYLNRRY